MVKIKAVVINSAIFPILYFNSKVFYRFCAGELQRTVEESGKLVALRELFRQCGIGVLEDYEIEDCTVQGEFDSYTCDFYYYLEEKIRQDFFLDSEASHMDSHRALVFCQRLSTVQLIAEFIDLGQLGSNIRSSVLCICFHEMFFCQLFFLYLFPFFKVFGSRWYCSSESATWGCRKF